MSCNNLRYLAPTKELFKIKIFGILEKPIRLKIMFKDNFLQSLTNFVNAELITGTVNVLNVLVP